MQPISALKSVLSRLSHAPPVKKKSKEKGKNYKALIRLLPFITLLILLIGATILFPVYSFINLTLHKTLNSALKEVESKAGITLTYSHISPALLTSLKLNDIRVSEASSKDLLLEVKTFTIRYSVLKLLKVSIDELAARIKSVFNKSNPNKLNVKGRASFLTFFQSVNIDGILFNLTSSNIAFFNSKLGIKAPSPSPSLSPPSSNIEGKEAEVKTREEIKKEVQAYINALSDLSEVINSFPFAILVKNVHLRYTQENKASVFDIYLNSINVKSSENKEQLAINTQGRVEYSTSSSSNTKEEGAKKLKNRYLLDFNLKGLVFTSLNNSNFTLSLFNITNGTYSLNRLNLMVRYLNGKVEARTIQNSSPFYLTCEYDIESTLCSAAFFSQGLNLSSLVSVRQPSSLIKSLDNLQLTAQAVAEVNLQKKTLNYFASGNLETGDLLPSSPLNLVFDVAGDEKEVALNKFEITGKVLNASAHASLIFEGLKLNGEAILQNFTLPNGQVISTNLYFDRTDKGFMYFAPSLDIGYKSFSGLQGYVDSTKNALDFTLELTDYSRQDSDTPGVIKLNGSYLLGDKYVQASLDASSIYIESLAQVANIFTAKTEEEALNSNKFSFLSPYIFNSEVYLFSNLHSFSFNLPYALLVNTNKDNEALYLSADGNESGFQITELNIVAGKLSASFTGLLERATEMQDKEETSKVKSEGQDFPLAFLMLDTTFNSIPYHFNGNIFNNSISITGDYGVAIEVHKSKERVEEKEVSRIDGSVSLDALPLSLGSSTLYFTVDSGFSYSTLDNFNFAASKVILQGTGGKVPILPTLTLTGLEVTKYGAFINKVNYKDIFSNLDGGLQVMWNTEGGNLNRAQIALNLQALNDEQDAKEKKKEGEELALSIEVTNPENLPLTLENLLKHFYFNSQINATNFELNRFLTKAGGNNKATLSVIFTGMLENPYLGFTLDSLTYTNGKKNLFASLTAFMEEKVFTISDARLKYNRLDVTKINGSVNLNTLEAGISCDLDTYFLRKTFHIPINLSVSDLYFEDKTLLPKEAVVNLTIPSLTGSFIKKPFTFSLTALHSGENTTIFTNEEVGLIANITNSGDIEARIGEEKPLSFNFKGSFKELDKGLNFSFSSVKVDVGTLWSYTNFPYVNVFNAYVTGDFTIGGTRKEADLTGKLTAKEIELNVPMVILPHITVDEASCLFNHSEINIPQLTGFIKKKYQVFGVADVYLNGWGLDRVEANLFTKGSTHAPIDLKLDFGEFLGDAKANIKLLYQDHYLDIGGDISARNVSGIVTLQKVVSIPLSKIKTPKKKKKSKKSALEQEIEALPLPYFIRVDMNIGLEDHCAFRLDPLLRAVLAPNSGFTFKYDTEYGSMVFDGEVAIRSGDIAYLNRNFYLKEGTLKFSPNENTFNPIVTLEAQARDKDERGQDVRLILTAKNQYLFNLNPQLSSIPALSEAEINTMMGQLVTGDSEDATSFLMSVGDYALQSTVGRIVENKLRDWLHLDILSFRTSILQNAVKLNLGTGKDSTDSDKENWGRYFDNSTIYIGKYFGSTLYADAMLHWSYDESLADDNRISSRGMVFKPEIGLELESPFANIRWNMAPNISAFMDNRFSSTTSVTLSWKWAL